MAKSKPKSLKTHAQDAGVYQDIEALKAAVRGETPPEDSADSAQTAKPKRRASKAPRPGKKERMTFHLSLELINRLRNAVYWTPGLTLAGLAEEALEEAVAKLEKGQGKQFPQRKEDLKGGRPVKM